MTYYTIQDHNGQKIGEMTYLTYGRARTVARRIATMRSKMAQHRGLGIKIVEDDGSIYGGNKTVEWFNY